MLIMMNNLLNVWIYKFSNIYFQKTILFIVVEIGATQETSQKSQFIIFSVLKNIKKGI